MNMYVQFAIIRYTTDENMFSFASYFIMLLMKDNMDSNLHNSGWHFSGRNV